MPKARTFKFEISDGGSYTIEAEGRDRALSLLRTRHGHQIKNEAVIGLDEPRPRFWVKRGTAFYAIRAQTAAVLVSM